VRSALEWAQVRALAADGVSQREVARRLGISRNTVRRLVEADEPPCYAGSMLDPLEPVLQRVLKDWPEIRAPRVTEILREDYGYTGSVDLVRTTAPGTRYVLCVLPPASPYEIDHRALEESVRTLTGGRIGSLNRDSGDYTALAGLAGGEPVLEKSARFPFREIVTLDRLGVELRMEAWLFFDTIRRMGFGHVVAGRHHTLIVERGVSFVTIDDDGTPIVMGYDGNIFSPEPRYLIGTDGSLP